MESSYVPSKSERRINADEVASRVRVRSKSSGVPSLATIRFAEAFPRTDQIGDATNRPLKAGRSRLC